jgi:LmbE family N-acetylglucosaminyl deacetylase
MLGLTLGAAPSPPARVLVIGAHPDDIEIGCGGTFLKLIEQRDVSEVVWIVLSGNAVRTREAKASAEAMLGDTISHKIMLRSFEDGFFPYDGRAIKSFFEDVKSEFSPDLIFTHQRHDLHQDHRVCCELTWNTFRDHLILEYEVPKYDGDIGQPNLFVPLDESVRARKVRHLTTAFPSQLPKRWFSEELFTGLMRLRGMECNAPTSYAEAFYCRKATLG